MVRRSVPQATTNTRRIGQATLNSSAKAADTRIRRATMLPAASRNAASKNSSPANRSLQHRQRRGFFHAKTRGLSDTRAGTLPSHAWRNLQKSYQAQGFHAQVAEPGTSKSDLGNPHLTPCVFRVDDPSDELHNEFWC